MKLSFGVIYREYVSDFHVCTICGVIFRQRRECSLPMHGQWLRSFLLYGVLSILLAVYECFAVATGLYDYIDEITTKKGRMMHHSRLLP